MTEQERQQKLASLTPEERQILDEFLVRMSVRRMPRMSIMEVKALFQILSN